MYVSAMHDVSAPASSSEVMYSSDSATALKNEVVSFTADIVHLQAPLALSKYTNLS